MSGIELASGSKRLQVQWVPDVAPGTHAIRCLDWDRDRFDIEFGLVAGTTYNSFLIFGADKTALVDASHEKFRGLYLAELNARLAAAGRTLDYVIVSHTEPDHSGTVPDVLAAHPGATVLASRVALSYLANLTHAPFPQAAVKAGETVDLGGGHLLEFVPAPNLHWPDTMFTHDPASGTLFTCDAFGAHYCVEAPYDADLVALSPHFRFYFECLMLPNARSVSTALRKISGLKYATIGTGHGPILRHNVKDLVGKYGAWAAAAGKNAAAVAVLYCSAYGSERLSQSLARGITKAGGVGVEMVDLLSAEPQEVAEAVRDEEERRRGGVCVRGGAGWVVVVRACRGSRAPRAGVELLSGPALSPVHASLIIPRSPLSPAPLLASLGRPVVGPGHHGPARRLPGGPRQPGHPPLQGAPLAAGPGGGVVRWAGRARRHAPVLPGRRGRHALWRGRPAGEGHAVGSHLPGL